MGKSKQELDKDLMFSKIMPSLVENPFASIYSIPEHSTEESDALSALHSKLFARSQEYGKEESPTATFNVMEALVLRHIDSVVRRFNVCKCDRCRCDIAACALNRLPPKYVVTSPSKIAEAEKEIPQNLVMDALIKAVIMVRSNPRH